jgi:hypothetical protein
MDSNEPDLSAFPVIRIDQIPLVQSDTLQHAITEVVELVESMNADEGPKPPLLFYLQRQLDAMGIELTNRAAKERIHSLLNGANLQPPSQNETVQLTSDSTNGTSRKRNSTLGNSIGNSAAGKSMARDNVKGGINTTATRSGSAEQLRPSATTSTCDSNLRLSTAPDTKNSSVSELDSSKEKSSFQPSFQPLVQPSRNFKRIPLPSELAWQEAARATESAELKEKLKEKKIMASRHKDFTPSAWTKGDRIGDQVENSSVDGGKGGLISSRSEGDKESDKTSSSVHDTESDNQSVCETVKTIQSGASVKSGKTERQRANSASEKPTVKTQRRSHSISNNNPDPNPESPSKKALTALYKDFGSQFLVAGNHKKLRFYPEKVVVQSTEEIRERDRLDR